MSKGSGSIMMVKVTREAIKPEVLYPNWGVIAVGVGRKRQDIVCFGMGKLEEV